MKVMIAYDGSAYADAALHDLQRAGLPREVKALIVTVSDAFVKTSSPIAEHAGTALRSRRVTSAIAVAREQAVRLLAEARNFALQARGRVVSDFPKWTVRTRVLEGSSSRELLREAEEWLPDLIVVGSQGRSAVSRFLLGSVSKKLATDARSSVRVVRRTNKTDHYAPPRIMLGVDGSTGAERAVRAVGRRVWTEGTEVKIIAVDESVSPGRIGRILPTAGEMIRSSNEEAMRKARQMSEWAADELRAIGLNVSVAMKKGEPQRILLDQSRKWGAECVFVGSRGLDHPKKKLGLGSVATALVTTASCTVEIVRSRI
ncbi:MAG TPA: universal stress protein [Pyrinomonadaceae bacterium]|nr:universal stress protein [Pyrinomonadaceae bacterium]